MSFFLIKKITFSLSRAIVSILRLYNWTQFAFIYSIDNQRRCSFIQTDMGVAVDETTFNLYATFNRRQDNVTLDAFKATLLNAMKLARSKCDWQITKKSQIINCIQKNNLKNLPVFHSVFILCFDNDEVKRTFFLAVYDLKLHNNDEYVFIILELRYLQFSTF